MSIKDTIKTLEEADEKLERAVVLESEAVAMQRDAARLRDESDRDLEKVRIERANFEKIQTGREAESERKESELKNREVTLAAGKADLERNTAESNKDFETQHAALDARTVTLDNATRVNVELRATLDKVAARYKAIQEFITTTL